MAKITIKSRTTIPAGGPGKTYPYRRAAAKPFTQTNHPVGNLGQYAHEPKKGAFTEHHVKTTAPQVRANAYAIDKPDYKPIVTPKTNIRTTERSVAGTNMGSSDIKSESIGPDLGPTKANTDSAPGAYTQSYTTKQKAPGKVKKSTKRGTPFFGGM